MPFASNIFCKRQLTNTQSPVDREDTHQHAQPRQREETDPGPNMHGSQIIVRRTATADGDRQTAQKTRQIDRTDETWFAYQIEHIYDSMKRTGGEFLNSCGTELSHTHQTEGYPLLRHTRPGGVVVQLTPLKWRECGFDSQDAFRVFLKHF